MSRRGCDCVNQIAVTLPVSSRELTAYTRRSTTTRSTSHQRTTRSPSAMPRTRGSTTRRRAVVAAPRQAMECIVGLRLWRTGRASMTTSMRESTLPHSPLSPSCWPAPTGVTTSSRLCPAAEAVLHLPLVEEAVHRREQRLPPTPAGHVAAATAGSMPYPRVDES